MSRAGRILDLLDHLRAQDAATVAEIAAALGVSRRTILRDLATLRERGWPVEAEGGPGGGVRLRDRGLTAVHLREDEIAALWLAARLAGATSRLPWSAATRSALDRVLASVPEARARTLRRLLARVVVGPPATARVLAELAEPPAELLGAFEQAFARNACLAFDYVDRRGARTQRVVEPHGLLVEPPAWYLLTRDTATGEARTFRMDRIRRPRVLPERAFVPDFEGLRRQAERQRGAPAAPTGPAAAR